MTAQEFVQKHIDENEDWCNTIEEYFDEVGYDGTQIKDLGGSRWWNNYLYVQEIGGKLIAYPWATTTGDTNAKDSGWTFEESDLQFATPYTETITITKYKLTNEI